MSVTKEEFKNLNMNEDDNQKIKEMVHRRISGFLKRQRNLSRLTIDQVAERLGGESADTVMKYESGEIPLCELARLTEIYGTPPARLHRIMLKLQIDIDRLRYDRSKDD